MTVLVQMLDHFRSIARETEEEIRLIETGKLSLIRHGQDYTETRLRELIARLAKLHTTLKNFS